MKLKYKILAGVLAVAAAGAIGYGTYYSVKKDYSSNVEKPSPTPDEPITPDSPLTFSVTFKIIDGEGLELTQSVATGSYASEVTPLEIEGKEFSGWYVEDTKIDVASYPITQDTIFTAKYVNVYFATIHIDGIETTQKVIAGETLSLEEPTKEGYVFEGYYINDVKIEDITSIEITENVTITARFSKIYTVTFEVQGSQSTIFVKSGGYASQEDPFVDGYRFLGWSIDGEVISLSSYQINNDTTFIALFESDVGDDYDDGWDDGGFEDFE